MMRSGHKADNLQRRRRRVKLMAAPCAAVVLVYILAGSPKMPPLRRSAARSRSLLLLDTPQQVEQSLPLPPPPLHQQQQQLDELLQQPAFQSYWQKVLRWFWHKLATADVLPAELAACMADAEQSTAAAYTAEDFVAGRPARLKLEAVHHSRLPRPRDAVTMMLTASANRLHLLDSLCRSWPFPMAVAVYAPIAVKGNGSEASADEAVASAAEKARQKAAASVQTAFERVEALDACQASVALYTEWVTEDAQPLFPINSLRNQALLMATTDLVLVSNIDMLAGRSLVESLQNHTEFEAIRSAAESNHAIIVPAFETNDTQLAYRVAAGAKEALVPLWAADATGHLQHFRQVRVPGAHNATDYSRWVGATEMYHVNSSQVVDKLFEPWTITSRRHSVPSDERFRGYGKNKVQQVHAQMHVHRSRFVVHPRAFMVHRPHEDSAARTRFRDHLFGWRQDHYNLYKAVDTLFWKQVGQSADFKPTVSSAFLRCRHHLSWWRDIPGTGPMIAISTSKGAIDTA